MAELDRILETVAIVCRIGGGWLGPFDAQKVTQLGGEGLEMARSAAEDAAQRAMKSATGSWGFASASCNCIPAAAIGCRYSSVRPFLALPTVAQRNTSCTCVYFRAADLRHPNQVTTNPSSSQPGACSKRVTCAQSVPLILDQRRRVGTMPWQVKCLKNIAESPMKTK